jgi:hypothetical protein
MVHIDNKVYGQALESLCNRMIDIEEYGCQRCFHYGSGNNGGCNRPTKSG